ncbi:MAG: DMT family transporter [Cyanobacteria bacterium J06614_10]
MTDLSQNQSQHQPLNSQAMLVASRALSAARPAIISLLINSSAELSSDVAHPISFCNVLFVGNFSAALLVGFWFGFRKILKDFQKLKPTVKVGLILNGSLATLLSTLIFLGLQETSVTNAVLLGRLGPVLFALVGAIALKKRIKRLEWVGFSLIAIGVVTIALKTSQYQVSRGDMLILLSTLVFAISALINHLMIARAAALHVVVFSRNFLSASIFFVIAMKLFGPHHFADTFSGHLWVIMAIYALIVIVFAQFLWYAAINQLDSRIIGRLTVLSPVFGVTYAFLLNGERPSSTQLGTLLLIIVGVLIASINSGDKNPKMEMLAKDTENVASVP